MLKDACIGLRSHVLAEVGVQLLPDLRCELSLLSPHRASANALVHFHL